MPRPAISTASVVYVQFQTGTPASTRIAFTYSMPIDSVNTAMTPLQFARAHASTRTIETNAALSGRGGSGRSYGPQLSTGAETAPVPPHRLLGPVRFHWSYALAVVNGKPVAKRTPQFADTSYWSIAINRLG